MPVPFQPPLLAESVWLLNAPPDTCGNEVFEVGCAAICPVAALWAVDAAVFTVAVTCTRISWRAAGLPASATSSGVSV